MKRHHAFRVLGALALTTVMTVACSKQESTTNSTAVESTDTVYSATTDSSASTSTTGTMPVPAVNVSEQDRTFVTKAAEGGLAEVALGQTGSEKATNAGVKAFGQRIVTDHGNANTELSQLAQTKGLSLPTAPGQDMQAAMQHLSTLSGAEFDKAFMMHMVDDHEKDVKEFETASQNVTDPEIKAWAAKMLPILQDHLKMAKETQAKVK